MAQYPTSMPTWQQLERLPYLHAVVKEGLRYVPCLLSTQTVQSSNGSLNWNRLSYGAMRRLPRVFPDAALHYKQWTIPPGTPVGMAAYSLHTDPEVYSDPFEFRPERWLGQRNPSNPSNNMNRNWVPFSRGSRSCLGMKWVFCPSILYLKFSHANAQNKNAAWRMRRCTGLWRLCSGRMHRSYSCLRLKRWM